MFPCNCRPPFPRPEPFSPLPRPGTVPDWGKWIRDRLAEKGALLAFPTRTAFPSAGDGPNLYLAEDTGVVYRWGGEGYAVLVDPSSDIETYPGRSAFPGTGRDGVIYIDASANLLYRWNGTGYVLLTTDLSGVESRLADVESKVPAQATAQNQLADKAFVNSSIATNTAFYISDSGRPFQSLADLENYEGALTNNDYAFVVGRDAAGNTTYTRYKWNGGTEEWAEEYVLNNSSFTAEQWAAISSGITSGLVAKLGALPTAEALSAALAGKQDKLTFETSVVRNSDNPVKSSGIWSALWGALTALPAGISSLYDWCVAQLAGKEPLFTPSLISNTTIKTVFAVVKDDSLLKIIDIPTSDIKVNGKALTDDVTLTGADIAVSGVDDTMIANALAGKLDKSGGTVSGTFAVKEPDGELGLPAFEINPGNSQRADGPVMKFGDIGGVVHLHWRIVGTSDEHYNVVMEAANELAESRQITLPFTAGTLALAAPNPTAGNLAALDASGNPTDSLIPAANVALKVNIPYCIVTKNIENGAVTLDDHASNSVTITATLSPNALTINFPPLLDNGMVHDFAMRLNIAAGVTAPEIAWPQGVTLENDGGEMPEIADGGTSGSSTILYFSETENDGTTAKFLVKGETLTAIAQA